MIKKEPQSQKNVQYSTKIITNIYAKHCQLGIGIPDKANSSIDFSSYKLERFYISTFLRVETNR